jgi:hypothetical protein
LEKATTRKKAFFASQPLEIPEIRQRIVWKILEKTGIFREKLPKNLRYFHVVARSRRGDLSRRLQRSGKRVRQTGARRGASEPLEPLSIR